MQPVVSVIVPIYKVEPYLDRCVRSIIDQTYKNLEIILVDDGSPDNCPKMCDDYAKEDSRVVVIHKPNGGLSEARNAGLNIAKGDYVTFVDSDDWLNSLFVENLLDVLETEKILIGITNFQRIESEKQETQPFSEKKGKSAYSIFSSVEAIKKFWNPEQGTTFGVVWGKIYKKELFKELRFPKGKIHEDEYITYKALYFARQIAFIDKPLYNYFQRSDSIMGKVKKDSIRCLDAWEERYLFFKEHKEKELADLCISSLCWDFLYAYYKAPQKNTIEKYRNFVADYNKSSTAKFTHKFFLNFFARFPKAYLIYRKLSPIHIREY